MKKYIYILIMCICGLAPQGMMAQSQTPDITVSTTAVSSCAEGHSYVLKNKVEEKWLIVGNDGKLTVTDAAPATGARSTYSAYIFNALSDGHLDIELDNLKDPFAGVNVGGGETDMQLAPQRRTAATDAVPTVQIYDRNGKLIVCYNGVVSCTASTNHANTQWYAYEVSSVEHSFEAHTLSTDVDATTGLYSYVCEICGNASQSVKVVKDYAPNSDNKNLELTVTVDGETISYSTSETIALTDANQFVGVNISFSSLQNPTYTRSQKNQWGTIVLPFDVKNSEKYCFYTLTSVSGDALTITKVDDETGLAAGTPALIFMTEQAKNEATDKYDLTLTAANTTVSTAITNPAAISGLALTGTYSAQNIASENGYFISGGKFYSIAAQTAKNPSVKINLGAFRAYLKGTLTNGAAQLRISISDEEVETALEVLDALTSGEGEVYDLNGRRQQELREGVNIIKRGNKSVKVIVK